MASDQTEPVNFRPMQESDLEQVQAIDQLSFSMPWPLNSYKYELKNPASMLWVAEVNTGEERPAIVGLIVVWLILEEAHIATIAVHPGYRGLGIGKKLLAVALRESILKGAGEAMLEVRAHNLTAQAMYHQFGFEVVSRRPRYYRDNDEDALLMNVYHLDSAYLKKLEKIVSGDLSEEK
jgi:ribosomal-protein-alanine N-acetyltransferase